jgi:type IV secretion system protein VirB4
MFNGLSLNRHKSKKRGVAKYEYSTSNFIPYSRHYNGKTIVTKDGELISVIKVSGFSFETADDDDLNLKKDARNNLLKGFATGQFGVYFHTIRKKHQAYPDGKFSDLICKGIDDEWRLRHEKDYTFINEHYITILRKSNKIEEGFAKLSKKIASRKRKNNDALDDDEIDEEVQKELAKVEEEILKENHSQLEEVRDRIYNSLSGYQPEILEAKKTSDGFYCPMLEFLSSISNCCQVQKVLVPNISLDKYLQRVRLYFSGKTGEFIAPTGEKKYFAMVSLKDYRNTTHAGLMDSFLQLPFEFVISQSYFFIDKMIAVNKLQLQQRRLIQSEDVAISQIAEINEALDSSMSGRFAFGNHHMTVMCIGDSIKELDSNVSQTVVEFSSVGINATRERFNLEPAFWSQLPGNQSFIGRKSIINSMNVASLASLHNHPSGKRKGNHWGDAVTVFNTTSGTPYFFSFHVRDVGHTMIVGPTGAGKTVLMNFLCAQAQKFNPKIFFFDKDRGAEIFVRAIGGKYIYPSASEYSGFNPLQLADTYDNRIFLEGWFVAMLTSAGESLAAEDYAIIKQAVDGNYKLPRDQRCISNVSAFFGMEKVGSLANRLARWHGQGSKAKLFDNPEDSIDFSHGRVFGFEMGDLLKDKISLPATLEYLFHRISGSLDGSPTMIVLDEAWALIDNPVFGPKIKDWLKVLRKLNAMVVFATQSVEDATKSNISDTLVQQTATQIFLPNLKATEEYKRTFMLTDREFNLVKTTDPGTRFFLVKQDSNAVITRISLAGMDDIISILSGRVETVDLLDKIRAKVGDDPSAWLPIFLDTLHQEKLKKKSEKSTDV